jgi:hypothetical protein
MRRELLTVLSLLNDPSLLPSSPLLSDGASVMSAMLV